MGGAAVRAVWPEWLVFAVAACTAFFLQRISVMSGFLRPPQTALSFAVAALLLVGCGKTEVP
jgi:hypothetical protein